MIPIKATVKKFTYRIKPHKIMSEEYPSSYYKFRNEKVASAFFKESCGNEHQLVSKH